MYDNHGNRLTFWTNQPFLSPANLERYARAITKKGSPLTKCFGFIDGMVRQISRPGENQCILCNGRKRVHALKFESVAILNVIIANLHGPVEGCRHDAGMLKDSGLLHILQREAYTPRGSSMLIWRSPLPSTSPVDVSISEADVPILTPEMRAFNTAMSEVRVSVEWLFGNIVEYFKFIDYKKNL